VDLPEDELLEDVKNA